MNYHCKYYFRYQKIGEKLKLSGCVFVLLSGLEITKSPEIPDWTNFQMNRNSTLFPFLACEVTVWPWVTLVAI